LANGIVEPRYGRAEVAELADASVSKTDVRKDVRVRLPLSAPRSRLHIQRLPASGPADANHVTQGGDDAVDIAVGHFGKHRQRQNPTGCILGDWKRAPIHPAGIGKGAL
jgi:hypothetical protein